MRRLKTAAVLVLLLLVAGVMTAPTAQAAPVLSFANTQYTPGLGWDVVGLDSNNVNAGPNQFAKGVRVCNTGDATATNIVVRFFFDSTPTPSTYINLQPGSPDTLNFASLDPGSCLDAYFNIEITRSTAAWNTYSRYHITATADGLGTISTQNCFNTEADPGTCGTGPYDGYRQLFVEKLISQNRNNVNFIKYLPTTTADNNGGPGYTCTNGVNTGTGSNVVVVGYEYYICLSSSTATNGYEQITTYVNLPNVIFQTLGVTATYTAPTGGTGNQIYEDACQWYQNPYNSEYWRKNNSDDCQGTGKYGGVVTMIFKVRIISAGGPSTASALVYDFSGSSFHYNGGSSSGSFLVCPENCFTWEAKPPPWSATFGSASAVRTPDGVDVSWTTEAEVDNLGFNVYAEAGGQRVKLNDEMIAGAALGAQGGMVEAGGTYHWLVPPDHSADDGIWIEAVGMDGSSDWHGPIAVEGTGAAPERSAPTMRSLASVGGVSQLAPRSARAADGNPGVATAIAQGPAVKVGVDREGWYRVGLDALAARGLDTSNPARLHLWTDGVEQPLRIRDGGLEFYGLGLDTPTTDTRTYWVTRGRAGGPTVGATDAGAGTPGSGSFRATVERRDRSLYFATLRNGEASNYFGSPVTAGGTAQTIEVPHVADPAGATLDVGVQGVTMGPHLVDVQLNGQSLGTLEFKDRGLGSASFPATGLVEGENTVTLTSSGQLDIGLVDAIRVRYDRALVADGDALRFTAQGGERAEVTGFGGDGVRVVDVTDPEAPVELATDVQPDGGGFKAAATAPGAGKRVLYAYAGTAAPETIVANRASRLRRTSNAADLLVIGPRQMKSASRALMRFHRGEGLRARFVDVEDVVDEFGAGTWGPKPLRAFLTYAHRSWDSAPRYVLLAGDASLDPRGFIGKAGSELVPTKLVDTDEMETASDNWLADTDGDLRPDVAIGRLPAGDPVELSAMVDKTLAYARSGIRRTVVIPFDGGKDYNYARAARRSADRVPAGYDVRSIDGGDADANQQVLDAFGDAPKMINYIGHGSVNLWRGGLLEGSDASQLADASRSTIVVAMTCLNGYFQDEGLDSLSESLMKADGGAVAAWASSGYTYPNDQKDLSRGLYASITGGGAPRLGDVVNHALRGTSDEDDLRTWILFGDPAMRVR